MPYSPLPADCPAPAADSSSATPVRRIVSRLLPRASKRAAQVALSEGQLNEIERLDLLAPERLDGLAVHSLWLLAGSGAVFLGLDVAARVAQRAGPLLGTGSPWVRGAALVLANMAAYAAILPLHEGVHALVILALGGRPRFGLKPPLAAFCTAPGQLFTRNGYTVVALAPLVAISAAGAVVTWLAPDVGACILFGLAGNVSGAVADLAAVSRLQALPSNALILDTETGYAAFQPPREPMR